MPHRRFSQAISEGDGISVLVDVHDDASARAAEEQGAEALVVRGPLGSVRDATELPVLWCAPGSAREARDAGADAYLVIVENHDDEDGTLEQTYGDAVALGLDCVVEVRSEEELELALERVDPEILLLSAKGEEGGDDALAWALELLPDVPVGKLAIAEAPVRRRDEVVELERAGVDAVIVGARDVAGLVGHGSPEV
jgi:indole-3-glycerol phosphate synthase